MGTIRLSVKYFNIECRDCGACEKCSKYLTRRENRAINALMENMNLSRSEAIEQIAYYRSTNTFKNQRA